MTKTETPMSPETRRKIRVDGPRLIRRLDELEKHGARSDPSYPARPAPQRSGVSWRCAMKAAPTPFGARRSCS